LIGGNVGAVLEAVAGSTPVVIGAALLAAVVCLVAAVVVAIWGVIKPQPFASVAADEITIYASERFLTEPDLWRVHVRSLLALEEATRRAQEEGNAAAGAIMISLYALLAGLCFSLISLATLVFGLI
jgi:FtsH-binding integral membrane protein